MLKFLMGTALGAAMAFVFVQFNIEPPAIVKLPEKLKANLVSSAVEAQLYDLNGDQAERARALKVYFTHRAADAVKVDAAAGHPFLKALHVQRARREARQMLILWTAIDQTLAQPALREVQERKYGETDTILLKQAILMDGVKRQPFLLDWLQQNGDEVSPETVLAHLKAAAKE